jgi:hypothetical protein
MGAVSQKSARLVGTLWTFGKRTHRVVRGSGRRVEMKMDLNRRAANCVAAGRNDPSSTFTFCYHGERCGAGFVCREGESEGKYAYANTLDCPEHHRPWRRRRINRFCVGRRISWNVGTAVCLHLRCVAFVQRPNTGCGPDRRLLTSKYRLIEQWLPGGIQIGC